MAVKNPKKQFNFRVQIPLDPSFPIFSFQELNLGDSEVEPDTHGHANTEIKTAGLVKTSNITMNRIMPANATDAPGISKYFWRWQRLAGNSITGTGATEETYKRNVLIHELKSDGVTVVNTFIAIGAWPSKINGKSFKRGESGNLVEEIELCVDYLDYQ